MPIHDVDTTSSLQTGTEASRPDVLHVHICLGPGAPTDFQKFDALEVFDGNQSLAMTKHKREAVLIETTKSFCQKFILDAHASSASAWGRPCLGPNLGFWFYF